MMPSFFASRFIDSAGSVLVALVMVVAAAGTASATVCTVSDNGGGTATLPPRGPGCPSGYQGSSSSMIVDGLPPGQAVSAGVQHFQFLCPVTLAVCSFAPPAPGACDQTGGVLGGERACAGSTLRMTMTGTGGLAYNRIVDLPIDLETHIAQRTPGLAVQSFDTDMFRLFGQILGDPDFDLLRITGGSDFGLPSPGHTTLTQTAGGNWNVDSFFDITYRVDFVGHPGGPFGGMSGSTTGTIRVQAGEAAVFDHLECFKPKDPLKFKATVDLPSLAGGLYDAVGCVVTGKATKYCTPVAKIVTTSDVPITPMPGPALTSDYACYKLKCPKVVITQGIVDQFGARVVEKLKQQELCVPAQRTP